jgi:membrane-bound lytic murein transglycosylase D
MIIRKISLAVTFLFSFTVFAQDVVKTVFEIKPEAKISYLDSVKNSFVKTAVKKMSLNKNGVLSHPIFV